MMKKICLFLCLVCCFGISNAEAKCKILNCDRNGDLVNAKISTSIDGGNQCWWCGVGPNSCGHNDVVPIKDAFEDVVGLKQCNISAIAAIPKFSDFSTPDVCPDSPIQRKSGIVKNAKLTYSTKDHKKTQGKKFGDWDLFDGSISCRYIKCNKGFVPNADKTDCVALNTNCQKTDGNYVVTEEKVSIQCEKNSSTISGTLAQNGALTSLDHVVKNDSSKCTATCTDGGWDITLNSNGCVAGYEPDTNRKACQETAGTKKAREDKERAAERNACVNSGGTWNNGTGCTCNKPHMKDLVKGKTCQCESDAYVFNKDKHVCEITDTEQLRQNCEKAAKNASSGVEGWDGVSKCTCKQSNEMYNFDGVSKCVQDERYKLCAAKSNEAYWNHNEDKCVCTDKDFEWNYNRCDKKGEVVIAENEANATKQITTLVDGLKTKFASFEKSVWKDKEGNFNKARLASDSIAGVVLGTAGGLITSKVVKKNQVKSGFEDVNCVIGGQKVADYGDEFTVGIK